MKLDIAPHMPWLRWVGLGVLGVLLVVVLAFGYLVQSFDPNDYRAEIIAFVEDETGHTLNISGPMKLRLKPPLIGFEARRIKLGNLPGFPGPHLLAAERFEGYLNFLPLLTGALELHSVHIEGLDVHLERKLNRSANWQRLLAGGETTPPRTVTPVSPAVNDTELSVLLHEVRIRNSALKYHDAQRADTLEVTLDSLTLSDIGRDGEADLELAGQLRRTLPDGTTPVTLGATAQATVLADPNYDTLAFEEITADLDIQAAEHLKPAVEAERVALNFAHGRYTATALEFREGLATLRIDPLTIEQKGPHSMRVAATLHATGLAPRRTVRLLPTPLPVPENPDVMAALDFQGDLQLHLAEPALSEVRVDNITARLDQTDITGGISVLDFDQPRVGIDLALGSLDLDAYLPLAAQAPDTPMTSETLSEAEYHPTTGLHLLDGAIRLEQLRWRGLDIAALDTQFGVEPTRYHLRALSGRLEGSNIRANGSINIGGGIPEYHLAAELEQLEIGKLLSRLTAKGNSPLEGATDLQLDLTGRGTETERFLSSLGGTIGIVVQNGALHVGSVAHAVESAIAVLQERPGQTTSAGTLPFNLLRSSWEATDGRFHSNDLVLDADDVHVTAQGHLDWPKQEANYRFLLQLGEGLSVPGRIDGPFDNLSHSVDLSSLVRDQVSRQIRDFFGDDSDAPAAPTEPEGDAMEDEPVLPVPDLLRGLF